MSDAVRAILYPFAAGMLRRPEPGRAFFLRAEPDAELDGTWRETLVCQQTFKPAYDHLRQAGFRVAAEVPEGPYDVGLVLATKHKAETLANIARAWSLLRPGGTLVCAGGNDVGAGSIARALKDAVGEVGGCAKHHCKVFWVTRTEGTPNALEDWAQGGRLQRVAATGCLSRPGLYNWDKVDRGSALLAAHFPTEMGGKVADLGAGWGYLSIELLKSRPGIISLDLYEAEALALDAAKANLEGGRVPVACHWADVALGIEGKFDWVVTNPPFHSGKATDVDLGRAFVQSAARVLAPGGKMVLVANRQLPYEAEVDRHFRQRRTLAEEAGFKVIQADL